MLASQGLFEGERDLRVLDLYAGSGALGLEAMSRGARSAVLVESARPALAAIRENTRALGLGADQVTVMAMRVERALATLEGPFELILVDPPYAEVATDRFRDVLGAAARLLVDAGLLVLEHASSDEPPSPEELALDRRRRHGTTTLSLFRRAGGPRQT